MIEQYLETLSRCCSDVLSEMTGKRARCLDIVTPGKELSDFVEGKAIEYTPLDPTQEEPGYFILGFNSVEMACAVASDISLGLGLGAVRDYSDDCGDILSEFLNIVVGRTVTQWDHQGFPVRFGQPIPLASLDTRKFKTVQLQRRRLTFGLGGREISLMVTFHDPNACTEGEAVRILVVDDSPIIRKMLVRALNEQGYAVEEATNGREAVIIFKTFQPRLTIMDLVMPEMMGLEAIAQIRQSSPEARFLILSSSARRDEVVQARELGVMDYVLKPIQFDILRERVEKALAGPRRMD